MRLSLYRTLSWRYLQQRWSRAAMIVASIALGVATVVATQALNTTMTAAAQVASRPLAGLADLSVTNGDAGVDKNLAAELVAVPGVRAVMPLLVERVALPDLDNRPAQLVGVDLSLERQADNPWRIDYQLTAPVRAVTLGQRAMLVGRQLAHDLSQAIPGGATEFRVLAAGRTRSVPRWVGTVDAHGPAASLGGNVLFMDA